MKTPPRYINRELSWLDFNTRVLAEGRRADQPLLESLKFLSIVSSNLDEFSMVRIAGLKHQVAAGDKVVCPSGLRPSSILRGCSARIRGMIDQQHEHLRSQLLPGLESEGLLVARGEDFTPAQVRYLSALFDREIFPILTPIAVDPEKPLLLGAGLDLHVGCLVRPRRTRADRHRKLGVIQIPPSIQRFILLPHSSGDTRYARAEDVVARFAEAFFPGHTVEDVAVFRITRDADLGVDEQRDEDYLAAMQEALRQRNRSAPIRLEIQSGKEQIRDQLRELSGLGEQDVYEIDGPLDLGGFMGLCSEAGCDHLRHAEWQPQPSPALTDNDDIWGALHASDVLLHHPYESFDPVVRLLTEASADEDVLAIKMTLYRTSGHSPIIAALIRAARRGAHVVVVVEVKARFDEQRNIEWVTELEQAGVIVVYGIAGLKVHAKATLIIRREPQGIARYVHLGTGNYNDKTARLYTDLGLLSARDDLAADVALFFNAITGYSSAPALNLLVMAPSNLKSRLESLVRREMDRSTSYNPGRIVAKMNSLVDPDMIALLYKASEKGVEVSLNVRGICCLVPGVPGLSENIHVVSIVDHYLEHSRVFWFHNGGNPEVCLSSADWMPRNLERRVELMFPILDEGIRDRVTELLMLAFRDTTHSYAMQPDGSYVPRLPKPDEEPFRLQQHFTTEAERAVHAALDSARRELQVRKRAP